jgi:hypothetical protein
MHAKLSAGKFAGDRLLRKRKINQYVKGATCESEDSAGFREFSAGSCEHGTES